MPAAWWTWPAWSWSAAFDGSSTQLPNRHRSVLGLYAADEAPRGAMVLLAFVFAATWVVSTGMAAHLPRLLQAAGASPAGAVAAAALVGPAQVAARLIEYGLMRRAHPLVPARIAAALHPIGAMALAMFGGPAAAVFTVLHGAGNGLLTIAKGTLPLALFGPAGYGLRTGLLSAPSRVAQAGAPLLFGFLLDQVGTGVLAFSAGLGVASTAALLALKARHTPPETELLKYAERQASGRLT